MLNCIVQNQVSTDDSLGMFIFRLIVFMLILAGYLWMIITLGREGDKKQKK